MLYLKSDRLRVEIAEPSEVEGLTTRFDHTSFVSEVLLDGKVRFCASEPRDLKDPTSGGRGLCCEIQFDPSGEADIGSSFPKLGVGLLTKPDEEPYRFSRKYICVPFETRTQAEPEHVRMITMPGPSLGYAACVTRDYCVEDDTLIAEVLFENTGEKTIRFREYCHNFLSLDGMALDGNYSLTLDGVKDLARWVAAGRYGGRDFACSGETVSPAGYIPGSSKFEVPAEGLPEGENFSWTLAHKSCGVSVRCVEGYRPIRVPVWVDNHMICPEAAFSAAVKPGERCRWSRRWTFMQEERET